LLSVQEQMGTVQEGELEQLLAAAAQDPVQRPAFERAIIDSDIYVLGWIDGDSIDDFDGGIVIDDVTQTETPANLQVLNFEDGPITPFFTSQRMLEATLAECPWMDPRFLRLACGALFEMTQGSRLILNPHGPYAKIYTPAETAALVAGDEAGLTAQVVGAGQQIFVGAAAHIPPELPAVLSRFFAQRSVVEAAYLGWVAHPDGHTGYLLVLITSDGNEAMSGFGALQIGELTGGPAVDIAVVPPGGHHHLDGVVPPFYVRRGPSST
jgi:hypothetical protein